MVAAIVGRVEWDHIVLRLSSTSKRDYLEDLRKVAIYSVIVMIAFIIVLTIFGLVVSIYDLLFVDLISIE
jgi:hypothetical protein